MKTISKHPSNGQLHISYQLGKAGKVAIAFYDISGKLMQRISQGQQAEGSYHTTIDLSQWANGVYFYSLQTADGKHQMHKLVLNK